MRIYIFLDDFLEESRVVDQDEEYSFQEITALAFVAQRSRGCLAVYHSSRSEKRFQRRNKESTFSTRNLKSIHETTQSIYRSRWCTKSGWTFGSIRLSFIRDQTSYHNSEKTPYLRTHNPERILDDWRLVLYPKHSQKMYFLQTIRRQML